MKGLKYEVSEVNGKPTIHLSSNGSHIASIWGKVKLPESDFERAHDIIEVLNAENLYVAIIWGATPK